MLIFLILYEIPGHIQCQEYLKDLQPKNIKFDINHELPPVEKPKPISNPRYGRADDIEHDDELEESTVRHKKSQRPTLIDIALESSVNEGLTAMRQVYGVIEPNMIRNGR